MEPRLTFGSPWLREAQTKPVELSKDLNLAPKNGFDTGSHRPLAKLYLLKRLENRSIKELGWRE